MNSCIISKNEKSLMMVENGGEAFSLLGSKESMSGGSSSSMQNKRNSKRAKMPKSLRNEVGHQKIHQHHQIQPNKVNQASVGRLNKIYKLRIKKSKCK